MKVEIVERPGRTTPMVGGRRTEAGEVVDVPEYVGKHLIARGAAKPAQAEKKEK